LCVLLLDDFALAKFVPRGLGKFTTGHRTTIARKPIPDSVPNDSPSSAVVPLGAGLWRDRPRPFPAGRGGVIGRWFGMSNDQPRSGAQSKNILAKSGPMRWPWWLITPVAVVFIAVSILQIAVIFGVPAAFFGPVTNVAVWISPFRTVNNYGLFAVMTTQRHEIVIQGSDDGIHWRDYEFKYKPCDLKRPPKFVAPHMPRVDWQMWFAALGDYQDNPWLENFCVKLLQGSPRVLALLAKNPFPQKPPGYIRAEVYDYKFTNFAERRASGAWWKREFVGEYLPPVSLHE
jgi:lipase maturation factor